MATLTRSAQLLRMSSAAHVRRHFGVTSVAAAQAKMDPIQKLFIEKIQEYKKLSATGKLPDLDQSALQDRLDRVASTYGADKEDFSKFPALQFKEPTLETVEYQDPADCNPIDAFLELAAEEGPDAVPFTGNRYGRDPLPQDIFDKEYAPKHEKAGTFDRLKFF